MIIFNFDMISHFNYFGFGFIMYSIENCCNVIDVLAQPCAK